MSDKPTEDMLRYHMDSTVLGLMEALAAQRRVDESGEPDEELGEYPLDDFPMAANLNMTVSIQVAFGGPNIWIEVPVYNDGRAAGAATLHGAWGGSEVPERHLTGDARVAALRIAERYAEAAIPEVWR